jgi:hypothetical protein
MKTPSSSPSLTLSRAFEQFLEVSSFARRTQESYAEDLASLFAECGQLPITGTSRPCRRALERSNLLIDGHGSKLSHLRKASC